MTTVGDGAARVAPVTVSNLDAALALAESGAYVFPLIPGGKRPLSSLAPHGQDSATCDPERVRDWWSAVPSANIGVACAPSGLYVVDIDCKGDAPGFQSWADLTRDRAAPPTYTVRTWSGGLHLYFRMPSPPLKNSASKLGPGIDTRGNGYVVAPPSVIDGMPYVVEDYATVADLPEWIAEALSPSRQVVHLPVSGIIPPAVTHAPAAEVLARVDTLAAELAQAPEGAGNATAARIAFMVGGYVGAGQLTPGEASDALLGAIAGWTYRDSAGARAMENTILRQLAEGAKNPRAWEAARFLDGATTPEVTEAEEELPSPATDWATDQGQARYLKRFLGGMIWATGLGWHLWDGVRWRPSDDVRVAHIIAAHYKSRFDHHVEKYKATLDPVWSTRAEMFKKFMSSARTAAIMKALQGCVGCDPDELDSNPMLLNTPGGIVDLTNGSVRPHDPAALMTKVTRGNYVQGCRHPDWDAALESLPADVRPFFQLRAGQAATGHIPESDDCLVLQGNGANGKSLMASDGIMPALGDYAMLASPGLILAKDSSGGATPERASVRGARFVLIEELPEGRALSIEEIKRIIGTSSITARLLYQQEMTFRTSHTLFVTTNYLPSVNETDDGAWRRLCLVNFPYRFSSSPEGDDEKPGDPGLKRRVRLGAQGQHDAIVTWIVEGAIRHHADPMAIMPERRPARVTADTRAWRATADRIMAYWDARLVPDPACMVAKADLYADFVAFLSDSGHTKWSQETFFGRLTKHALYRRAGLSEGRVRALDGLDRPGCEPGMMWSSTQPSLGAIPRVIKGVRFRRDADDELALVAGATA